MKQRIHFYLRAFVASFLLALVGFFYYYYHLFHVQVIVNKPQEIYIEPGQSIVHIAYDLKKQGLLPHPKSFIFFTKLPSLSAERSKESISISFSLR